MDRLQFFRKFQQWFSRVLTVVLLTIKSMKVPRKWKWFLQQPQSTCHTRSHRKDFCQFHLHHSCLVKHLAYCQYTSQLLPKSSVVRWWNLCIWNIIFDTRLCYYLCFYQPSMLCFSPKRIRFLCVLTHRYYSNYQAMHSSHSRSWTLNSTHLAFSD